jgi:nucleotide-binding universal stress UspA family protein
MYKKILIGFDSSEGAKSALIEAVKLAKALGSELTAIWVRGSLPHFPETVDEVEEENSSANSFFKKLTKEIHSISNQLGKEINVVCKSGNPAKTIMEFSKANDFDLIILGSKGASGLWGNVLGHVSDRVSENAYCSVLIVRKNK